MKIHLVTWFKGNLGWGKKPWEELKQLPLERLCLTFRDINEYNSQLSILVGSKIKGNNKYKGLHHANKNKRF